MRILVVVTNCAQYAQHPIRTGLWLSEVTHLLEECKQHGISVDFASPLGGETPVDPESLRPLVLDQTSYRYHSDSTFIDTLKNTKSIKDLSVDYYDVIYLSGGHGTMYDFVGNESLNALVQQFYESGKIVSAICHGVCGLIDVKLSNDDYLINNKSLTGYSWFEELLARRRKQVPFNLEKTLQERGAIYRKAFFPLTSNVVIDQNLITGQNPFSSREMARKLVEILNQKNKP